MEEIIEEYRKREMSLDKVALQPDGDGGIPMDMDDGFTIPKRRSPAKKPPTPPRQTAAPHHQPQRTPNPPLVDVEEEEDRRRQDLQRLEEIHEQQREKLEKANKRLWSEYRQERRGLESSGSRQILGLQQAPLLATSMDLNTTVDRVRSVEDKEAPGSRRSRQRVETD